jgi:predicted ferric reductase
MYWMVRGILWFGLYVVLILLPLLVGKLYPGEAAGKTFLHQFGVACGFVGLCIMAFEFVLISKVASIAAAFGQDALIQFHRAMGFLAVVMLLIHPALMIQSGYPVAWLNPLNTESPWAMRWGILATLCLLLLTILSVWRVRLKVTYGWWQLTHGLLADAIVIMSLVHVLMFGGFAATKPMQVLLEIYYALLILLALRFKVINPLRIWSKRWEVTNNISELGDSQTVVLRPAGHKGFSFEPGQFAWINTGRTPFHKDQHPISFSSCGFDEPGREVAFTIKDLGDWSGQTVPDLKPGDKVWIDGPYGVFSTDREQGPGYVLIAGGVGITPMRSMCLTMAERGDKRPVLLLFGTRDAEGLTFRDDFEKLKSRMNLQVVYVLSNPKNGEGDERGYINADVLRKYLPPQYKRFQYFICGPGPLMDAMEEALPALGVPPQNVHTERFDMV